MMKPSLVNSEQREESLTNSIKFKTEGEKWEFYKQKGTWNFGLGKCVNVQLNRGRINNNNKEKEKKTWIQSQS
jgi:hypothetical protein